MNGDITITSLHQSESGHDPLTEVARNGARRPKLRDHAGVPAERKNRFNPAILPRWARRSKSLDALPPVLYLRGIATGNFQKALSAVLGIDAPTLSLDVISRLSGNGRCAWRDPRR